MKIKNLIYIGIFCLIVIVAITLSRQDTYDQNKLALKAYPDIIGGLDNLKKIDITNIENSIKLNKKNGIWVIEKYNSFPVDIKKINNFLYNISQISLIDKKTSDKKYFKNLGLEIPVTNSRDSVLVQAYNENAEDIVSFIIGKTSKLDNKSNINYFRKKNIQQAWLFKNEFNFENNLIYWADVSKVNIKRWRIKNIHILHDEKVDVAFKVNRKSYADQMFFLESIPKGYEMVNPYIANSYGAMLESLNIIDIKKIINKDQSQIKRIARITTFDGLIIDILMHKINQLSLYSFKYSYDSKVRQELPKDGPVIVGIPKMATLQEIKKEVKSLQYLSEWFYVLDDESIGKLSKNKSDLITKRKEAN